MQPLLILSPYGDPPESRGYVATFDFIPLLGDPREGGGYVATSDCPYWGPPEKAWVT